MFHNRTCLANNGRAADFCKDGEFSFHNHLRCKGSGVNMRLRNTRHIARLIDRSLNVLRNLVILNSAIGIITKISHTFLGCVEIGESVFIMLVILLEFLIKLRVFH